MAYLVLARKYRPQRFSDVAGQDHVTRTMMNALSQGRIAHGYIFSGHRGIGKTTIARILAMALNCRTAIGSEQRPTPEPCGICESCTEIRAGNAVDVIEIDAATNRGIDEIRELRDAARYSPARDRYKIYILDEAHQITDAAFNALLKTLEEPPDHVIFMMATTQPEDIPQTIRSRCQHFSFHAVRFDDILAQLRSIATAEDILAEDAALALLAEAGDGSMRDALSIMDQAIASAPMENGRARLDAEQIRELMGTVPNSVFEHVLQAVSDNQSATVIEEINRLLNAGHSPSQLARQFVRYLRNCLMARLGGEATELIQLSPDERARAVRSASLFSEEDLSRFLQMMLRTFDELNYRQEQRFHLELGLIKLVHLQRLLPIEELLSQLPVGGAKSGMSRPAATLPSSGRSSTPSAAASHTQTAHTETAHTSARTTAPASPAAPPAPAKAAPSFSPFEADRNRKSGGEVLQSTPAVKGMVDLAASGSPAPVPSPVSVPSPAPISSPPPIASSGPMPSPASPRPLAPIEAASQPVVATAPEAETPPSRQPAAAAPITGNGTSGALALAPEAKPASPDAGIDLDAIREAVSAALENGGHHTAAALLAAGTWSLSGSTIQAEVAIKKTMLGLTMNAEADKIARNAMRAGGWTQKLSVVPGNGDSKGGETKAPPRKASEGSAHGRALKHPLVQQAQDLFQAEVRNVLDLSEKS
ncbi:MAG TPA: DNA polymerase III subunit gamma/tau [Acidisarcina sp.]|nr:DNA polymerase III subunit gamma/tau [Acidisarcina sp.]